MKSFTNYEQAKTYAIEIATEKVDAGIEKIKEFGKETYLVKYLPKPENSFGHELRMERVKFNDYNIK